jgi:uncharacterized protein
MPGSASPPLISLVISRLWPFLAAALALYIVWLAAAWFLQRRILFPAQVVSPLPAAGQNIPGLERRWLESKEGRIEWWFVPAAVIPAPTVFYAHGNAELIDFQERLIEAYRSRGFNTVLCEYRGYGRSAGHPTEKALTADLVAVHDLVLERSDVDPERMVFHGRSIGTGVVCALAARREPSALILTSPFTSIADIIAGYWVPRPLVRDPFDNLSVLRGGEVPVLLLHGDRDTVIAVENSRELAAALSHATLVEFAGYGHNDLPTDGERYWQEIDRFLERSFRTED